MAFGKHDGLSAALRHRDFRLLTVAFAISAVGSWAYNVGLAVFVYDQTKSAAWVGAVTVGRFLPALLFGAYGGVLAERFERIRFMVRLDLICTALMGLLTLIAAVRGPVLLALVVAGVNSTVGTSYQPAVAAITPQVVPEKDLAAANTIRNTVENLAIIAGPALGAAADRLRGGGLLGRVLLTARRCADPAGSHAPGAPGDPTRAAGGPAGLTQAPSPARSPAFTARES